MASGAPLASGVERAILEGAGLVVPLGLNPKSLSIRRSAQWQGAGSRSTAGPPAASGALGKSGGTVPTGHGPLQYTRSQPAVLTMVVWFDRSFDADGTIDYEINQLQNWTCPTERIKNGAGSPPRITFIWRSLRFVGVISSLTINYKQFGVDGLPVRAEATISITENPLHIPGTNPTSGGISGRRVHTFSAGDTLHSVAYAEYGNPGLWRVLAEVNGVDDPLRITPGTALLIPPDPHSGGAR
jgi:nucleoid-associated protein YgaU